MLYDTNMPNLHSWLTSTVRVCRLLAGVAGVGAAIVQPGSSTSSSMAVLQPGRGAVKPALLAGGAVPPSGGWAELSAAAVQSGSGTLFTAAHFASVPGGGAAESSTVGSWLSTWSL